ncbi:unnamed protein product [Pleuronectes platessa]|uniref:Uncharacterized protein n=1 Tax=Pleuronectes platessa TaxID=8262 RepID=A0A9N7YUU9_PLEPL|nr:unnamed protein product [Pleuronectes platessa]
MQSRSEGRSSLWCAHLRDITSSMNDTNVRSAEREGWGRGGIDGGRPLSQMSDSLSSDGETQRGPLSNAMIQETLVASTIARWVHKAGLNAARDADLQTDMALPAGKSRRQLEALQRKAESGQPSLPSRGPFLFHVGCDVDGGSCPQIHVCLVRPSCLLGLPEGSLS